MNIGDIKIAIEEMERLKTRLENALPLPGEELNVPTDKQKLIQRSITDVKTALKCIKFDKPSTIPVEAKAVAEVENVETF